MGLERLLGRGKSFGARWGREGVARVGWNRSGLIRLWLFWLSRWKLDEVIGELMKDHVSFSR